MSKQKFARFTPYDMYRMFGLGCPAVLPAFMVTVWMRTYEGKRNPLTEASDYVDAAFQFRVASVCFAAAAIATLTGLEAFRWANYQPVASLAIVFEIVTLIVGSFATVILWRASIIRYEKVHGCFGYDVEQLIAEVGLASLHRIKNVDDFDQYAFERLVAYAASVDEANERRKSRAPVKLPPTEEEERLCRAFDIFSQFGLKMEKPGYEPFFEEMRRRKAEAAA